MSATDPKAAVRDFLQSNMDGSAISVTFTPSDDVTIADYDVGPSYPSVAVVSADPVTIDGGDTGATAIDPSGAGPVQDVVTLVQVDCWGGPRDADIYQSEGSDPDTVAQELGTEVADECQAAAATSQPSGYRWIYADRPSDGNDTEDAPTEYRRIVTVRLGSQY